MLLNGSPEWQRYIFIAATVFLIWEIWRGWKLGAVRGLLRLGRSSNNLPFQGVYNQ